MRQRVIPNQRRTPHLGRTKEVAQLLPVRPRTTITRRVGLEAAKQRVPGLPVGERLLIIRQPRLLHLCQRGVPETRVIPAPPRFDPELMQRMTTPIVRRSPVFDQIGVPRPERHDVLSFNYAT